MCQENLILLILYVYSLRVFLLPTPRVLAHTDVLLPEGEVHVAWEHLLSSSFVEASRHNLRGDHGWGPRGGEDREMWLEETEVGTVKANSFCRTGKGTDGAG